MSDSGWELISRVERVDDFIRFFVSIYRFGKGKFMSFVKARKCQGRGKKYEIWIQWISEHTSENTFKKGVLFIYFLHSFDGTQDFPVTPGLYGKHLVSRPTLTIPSRSRFLTHR